MFFRQLLDAGSAPYTYLLADVPLGELRARLADVPGTKPVVAVCRSGRRSAQATVILQAAGRRDCANLGGGMLRWNALGLSVV